MQQQYVITFAGADRTGLVETLADLVKVHGGDWQRSELARLDGAFAGVSNQVTGQASING